MKKYTSFRDIPQFTPRGNYHVDYPIHRLWKWIKDEEQTMGLQLNPDFQRGHVWTEEQQIAYIEFLLRGGKSGRDIYLNCPSWHYSVPKGAYNDYVVVDGLQRITAIKRFVCDEIRVFGSYFSEYEDRAFCMNFTITVHVNNLKTKKEVLTWYLEMNTGGTPHSKEEISRVQNLLEELSE